MDAQHRSARHRVDCTGRRIELRPGRGRLSAIGDTGEVYRFAYLLNFLVVASIGAVFVFLSDIQEAYGLPDWGIGLIAATGFVTVLPVTFLVSPLADRGYTGILVLASAAMSLIGNLLFGFGDTLWEFVVSRGLLGAAAGMLGIATRKALIGTEVQGSGKKLGSLLSAVVAGFLLGPPLGAQLEQFGFATVFVLLGVLTVACALPVLPWAWNVPVSTSRMTLRSVVGLLDRPAIQGAALSYGLLFGSVGIFDSVIDIYLEDLGASNTQISVILVVIGLPLLLVPGRAGGFIERSDPRRILGFAMFVAVVSITGYGLIPSLYAFAVAGIVHSTVEGFAFPGAQIVAVTETGAAQGASGQALLEAAGSVAGAASALTGPTLYGLLGPRIMFAVYGLVVLIGALVVRNRFAQPQPFELAPAGEPVQV
jgi:predicted MFS family arabinose efflux permease